MGEGLVPEGQLVSIWTMFLFSILSWCRLGRIRSGWVLAGHETGEECHERVQVLVEDASLSTEKVLHGDRVCLNQIDHCTFLEYCADLELACGWWFGTVGGLWFLAVIWYMDPDDLTELCDVSLKS